MSSEQPTNYPIDPTVITITNVDQITELATLDTGRGINDIAFSPDGSTIAIPGRDSIHLWNSQNYTVRKTIQRDSFFVQSVAFDPNGKTLASGEMSGTLRLWNSESGEETRALTESYTGSIEAIAFSPDGRLLAFGGGDISSSPIVDYSVWVWDLETDTRKFVFEEDDDWVVSLAFSPNGQLLASGSIDGSIHLWDMNTGKKLNTLQDGVLEVYSISFNPNGQILASSSWLGGIRLWDISSGKLIKHWIGHGEPQPPGTGPGIRVKGIAFNKDGNLLVSVGEDGIIKFWNANTSKELAILQVDKPSSWLGQVAFSPDGKMLITGGSEGAKTRIWGIRQ